VRLPSASLRVRLFAGTAAALALTIGLTLAIEVLLTRRQVDRVQVASLARRADDLALQRRTNVSYVRQNTLSGSVRIIVDTRPALARYVRNPGIDSDGQTSYSGRTQLYSYRTLPHLGLLLLRPESSSAAAWRPFLNDLLLAALAAAGFAAILSLALARSIARPIVRVVAATRALAAGARHEPLPEVGSRELASLARAFNEMSTALAASQEAERAFLLSVSHELKTPLTAIRGYAEGLADGAFDPDEAARVIGMEAQRLERLVRDLLDLARMNRSEFTVRREAVDLLEVAKDAAGRHEAAARRFDLELVAEGPGGLVAADHDRLLQVASNLVENALRETPSGGRVTVRAEPGLITVTDTGPGIPQEDLPHAFERFFLYDKHGRDRQLGSGLGLAIVAELVRAMGGRVRVESPAGGGAAFVVELRPQPRGVDDLEVGAAEAVERV